MKNNMTLDVISGGGIIAFLTWLFNPAEITDFITNNPKVVIICFIILVCVIFGLIIYTRRNPGNRKSADDVKSLYDEGKTWTHTVLIIDDSEEVRNRIEDELQGFDVVSIACIEDYRLASEFEIIVSDIFGCSTGSTAASVLNAIKEKYPYKEILPMSAQPAACDRLEVGNDTILKDLDTYRFIPAIARRIREIGNNLSRVNDHWDDVAKHLKSRNISEKDVERIKMNYYRFVNKKQNGL